MGSITNVLGALRPVFDVAFGSLGPLVGIILPLTSLDPSKLGDL
ncbi:hypothetical protein [Prescottella agglutinans]|uniref:Uncharacterized protein n=1 Tax=Prescottella agglutinans TaxID=1644129 RepID=A0ABT6M700_9NOCA|nr:hypothetical protein [Prescottella agglutinans]MDH6280058.1 hypothetical protein [Prescottella agglutinans]